MRVRHPHSVEEEQGISREEVRLMMGVLADIDVNVRRILAYIEGEDDEEEEEDFPDA
jgi:hypothetical protein